MTPAGTPAPQVGGTSAAQQIASLAEALRGELELGSDGSTFEATIRLWLSGDYDGGIRLLATAREIVDRYAAIPDSECAPLHDLRAALAALTVEGAWGQEVTRTEAGAIEADRHRCPRCGRFTSGHAGLSEGSGETWYWTCACGARGTEGF